jgi:hypothetical protein
VGRLPDDIVNSTEIACGSACPAGDEVESQLSSHWKPLK